MFNLKKDEKEKGYPVSDFYLAAYLKAKDIKLINVNRDGKRVTFIFEDKSDCAQFAKDFYNDGNVKVNPFIHAIQDLKSIIYNTAKENLIV